VPVPGDSSIGCYRRQQVRALLRPINVASTRMVRATSAQHQVLSSSSNMADSDENDEDLRRAIALSRREEPIKSAVQGAGSFVEVAISLDSDEDSLQKPQTSTKVTNTNILGLDRKQMEEARLARKRKASISPPAPRNAARLVQKAPAEKTANDPILERIPGKLEAFRPTAFEPTTPSMRGPVFLQGACKKTWAFGHPREGDDIKLEEILQKSDLQLAVLSSFQWDVPWLLDKIDMQTTNVTLVMQAKDDATKQQYRQETVSIRNLRICFPSMEGQVNCMHSKLMLLSHPTYLRIAIPTANLVSYDWGESGIMENSVFVIDLPRLPKGETTSEEDLTFFGRELMYFLHAKGLEQSIVSSLYTFDLSATAKYAFVHTIGGAHTGKGDPWRRTGYCGLGRAVQALGLRTEEEVEIDFVTSSVGSLNMDFLSMIYLACQGDDGSTEYAWRIVQTGKGKDGQKDAKPAQTLLGQVRNSVRDNFRIYFPTHETVRNSTARSAGTICFQSKWYESPTFPRETLRDCKSVRAGMLMHNKV